MWSKTKQWISPLRTKLWKNSAVDPPIPPGATKFSYSTSLSQIRVRLCDTDMEFLEFKVGFSWN